MSTVNIAVLESQLAQIQAQIDAAKAREAALGETNMAVIRYHDIACRDSYCRWHSENDSAFANTRSEHGRLKGEYLGKKAKVESILGVQISHDAFLDMLVTVSGIYVRTMARD